MANTEKYLFENVFDSSRAVAGTPAARLLTTKEIQDMRDSAFAAGVNEGVAREHRTTEHRQSEALAAFTAQLKVIAETQNQAINTIIDEATKLTLAISRKISPALTKFKPLDGIEAMIRDFLQQLIDEPRIVVRLPEDLIDDLKRHIDDIVVGCGFEGRVVLMPDSMLTGNNCRLEWADGGAVRDIDAILDDIEAGIIRMLHSPTDLSGDFTQDRSDNGPGHPAAASQ